MRRVVAVRLVVYSLLVLCVIAIISIGILWYSMRQTLDSMYEPLPSTAWVQPVFEEEIQADSIVETELSPHQKVDSPTPLSLKAQSEMKSTGEVRDEDVKRLREPSLSEEDPFCILLLGVDERSGDRGRSDTMILLAIQPKTESAIALSIPRDTRTLIPGSGKYDKINHAYAFGGTSLAVEAVEQWLGVPIAYYMKTNMEGYVKIVDTLGGVDVNNQREFTSIYHFPEGDQHLNGDEALAYVRMRKEDPQGDFGRMQRQRQVLSAAVDQVATVSSVTKLPQLLSHLANYVRTNLTTQDLLELALHYRPAIKQVETLSVKGSGKMIDGIYYYTVQPQERQMIQEQLLQHLK